MTIFQTSLDGFYRWVYAVLEEEQTEDYDVVTDAAQRLLEGDYSGFKASWLPFFTDEVDTVSNDVVADIVHMNRTYFDYFVGVDDMEDVA